MSSQSWTVLSLLNWTRDYFLRTGIEQPRLAAEVLLSHVLKCERIDLYTRFEYEPTNDERSVFRRLVARAAKHEPVAYLVGYKEFCSLRFKVTPDVLVPRCETEILVTEAVAHLRALSCGGRVWDVCTGSGCVAVALASLVPQASVLATDISEPVVALAAENAAAHDVSERVCCRKADLLTLPEDCSDMAVFDVITANPPYVAEGDFVGEEVKHEPRSALYAGRDGLDFIKPIILAAPRFLRDGGALIMEFGSTQASAVREAIVATSCFAEPKILRDYQNIERVAVAVKKSGVI